MLVKRETPGKEQGTGNWSGKTLLLHWPWRSSGTCPMI